MNKKWILLFLSVICLVTLIYWPRPIVLRLGIFAGSNWDVPSGESYRVIDEAIERFENEHPNIQIEYESGILKENYSLWLSNQFLSGNEPDVFMVLSEDFNALSSLGALMNLDSYMDHNEFNQENYYESVLTMGVYQDHQYVLPYECDPTLMFINKTLLQKEGIEIPDNDWTLEDFYEICEKVTKDSNGDGVIDQYGCYNYDWLDSIYAHGVQLFNEEGTECYLNNEGVKESLRFIQRLNSLNQGHLISSTEFDKGQVAFSPMPFSQYRTYKPYPWRVKKYSTFEWDCLKMPSLSGETKTSQVSTLLMGISSRTRHDNEAWEFLKMLTYDEQTQQYLFQYSQGISSLKSVTLELDSVVLEEAMGDSLVDLSLLNEVMENTVSRSQFKKYESALNLIDTSLNQIIENNMDLDISLMNTQKEVNQYLKE